jgi:hypothetical protein
MSSNPYIPLQDISFMLILEEDMFSHLPHIKIFAEIFLDYNRKTFYKFIPVGATVKDDQVKHSLFYQIDLRS